MHKTYKLFSIFFYFSLVMQIMRMIYGLVTVGIGDIVVKFIPHNFFYYVIIEKNINYFYMQIYPIIVLVLCSIAIIVLATTKIKSSILTLSQEMRFIVPIIVLVSVFKMFNFIIMIVYAMNYDSMLVNLTNQFNGVFVLGIKFFISSIVSGILILYSISLIRLRILKLN